MLAVVLSACAGPAQPAQAPAAEQAAQPAATAVPADVLAAQPWRQTDAYSPLPERASLVLVKGGQENASLMPEGESIEDNRALQYIEDTLNVDVTFAWVVPSDSYSDKLNLSIASGDIPDVMTVDAIQMQQLTEAGAIEDLTPYVEKYANADILANWEQTGGVALQAATIDGKIMGIPNVQPQADAPIMVWVRQDWLDKLGLAAPETVDDVEAIAKAFIEQDPDGNGAADTIGLTGTTNPVQVPSNLHGFDAIFNAYGAFPELFYRNADGEIVYGSIQPETKEALTRLAAMYQAGIIDPEFATKDGDKANEIVVGGRGGIMMGPWWISWWPLADSVNNDPNADWQPFMIKDKNGNYTFGMGDYTYSFVVVKKGYPHPEIALKILNVQNDLSYGLNDAPQYYPNFNEIWTLLFPIPFLIEQPYVVERMATEYQEALDGTRDPEAFSEAMKLEYGQIQSDIAAPRSDSSNWATRMARLDAAKLLAGGYDEVRTDPVASRVFSTDPTWPALQKLEEETFLQIITGAKSIDDFDAFVEEWNNSGGAALLEKMNQ
ncbi:MAG: extracellular solute-binding protein [Caldilinea sp.]|nr:extracellular solute-binding protein [Caldilinea sp.]MCB0150104.1 extracellular solute-binding protein [Caldilineaceae bacterium]MCB0050680.1 extracellular solute-binding protein [Caldilinea sp.]MCB9113544.1 extracellular solute-binding protein [Caldilineaceae bacterium]MCB9119019.1 extracellular solute-binding protein [Caldilineaceae bacterium]